MNNVKTLDKTFLYKKANYTKKITEFLIEHERIDKDSDGFSDILYQIKMRQTRSVILDVLKSNKVVLAIHRNPMPKMLKVFRASNIKDNNKDQKLVYIDCTGIITNNGDVYKCTNIQTLMSYIIQAMTYIIYYDLNNAITRNTELSLYGATAFIDLTSYIFGYLKIPITFGDNREKFGYFSALYYLRYIVGKDDTKSTNVIAKKASKINSAKADIIDILVEKTFGDRTDVDITEYILFIASNFLNQDIKYNKSDKLTVEAFVSRWIYSFGPSTTFSTEFFPSYAALLTDCYSGSFINQQNTIEKIAGINVAQFTNILLNLGSDNK